jgi:hypothetical protein
MFIRHHASFPKPRRQLKETYWASQSAQGPGARADYEAIDSSGRKLNLSTCMPGFFFFCCPFGGFCPFPLFLSFLGHLTTPQVMHSSSLVTASWANAAHESKLSILH